MLIKLGVWPVQLLIKHLTMPIACSRAVPPIAMFLGFATSYVLFVRHMTSLTNDLPQHMPCSRASGVEAAASLCRATCLSSGCARTVVTNMHLELRFTHEERKRINKLMLVCMLSSAGPHAYFFG